MIFITDPSASQFLFIAESETPVEPLKKDLSISDVQVSFLQGLAFASIYCLAGIPLGRAADQYSRRNIIIAGVIFWSVMTMSCGVAGGFPSRCRSTI